MTTAIMNSRMLHRAKLRWLLQSHSRTYAIVLRCASSSIDGDSNNTALHSHTTTSTTAALPPPGPVLTFLSPNPNYSSDAIQLLHRLFQLPLLETINPGLSNSGASNASMDSSSIYAGDFLDDLHFGNYFDSTNSNSMKWDSKACICPSSGTILHFLSLANNDNSAAVENENVKNADPNHRLSLLSIHGGESSATTHPQNKLLITTEQHYREAVLETRTRLARSIHKQQFFPPPEINREENQINVSNDEIMIKDGHQNNSSLSSLASTMESRLRGLLFRIMYSTGKQVSPSWILSKIPTTSRPVSPLLDLTPFSQNMSPTNATKSDLGDAKINAPKSKLRELALPFFPEFSTLTRQLSRSSLLRPVPGLYQSPMAITINEQERDDSNNTIQIRRTNRNTTTRNPGLILRPLPAASEDLRLPPPSLVFQCPSILQAQTFVENELGGRTAKIGWRGDGACGSLMVGHPMLAGLDIRVCEVPSGNNDTNDWILTSSFDEAQEALLAGSLEELQSAHVVSEGAKSSSSVLLTTEVDSKVGNGDCWVEVRANVKHPVGFLKQVSSSSLLRGVFGGKKGDIVRVAKPPDLPFE